MLGILVITHGGMSQGLINAVELVRGKQKNYKTLSIYHEDSIEEFSEKIHGAIIGLNEGEGVIILTDLLSATPYNQAAINMRRLSHIQCRLISGVNLPMLLAAFNERDSGQEIELAAEHIIAAAAEGIKDFTVELNNKMKDK
ncbi:PTS sugar transporter subunit IIA [Acerihabitans sp. KWT182]|uniref:PTS sugar transporter subunit IIA n=1 Tax=Acerihabitans sp. KWT182 TaxID=3157919 RepID=A0AAU7QB93_9GAMM